MLCQDCALVMMMMIAILGWLLTMSIIALEHVFFYFYRHGWDGNRDESNCEGKEGEEKEPAGEIHLLILIPS